MEIIKHQIDKSIESYLAKKEWREIEPPPGSPYLGIPGSGGVLSVYQRAWWPTLVRPLVLYLGFLVLIVVLLILAYFLKELLAGAVSSAELRWMQLGLLAVALVFVIYLGRRMAATWPTRTPRSVALLNRGMAWLEADTLFFWNWDQVKAVRLVGYYLVIENRSGEAVRFHAGLYDTELGRRARMACGQFTE